MPSQFFGLNIGYTGLVSAQAAINTTGNNIANVETVGYSRQEALQQAEQALRTNARVSGPVPLPTRIERYTVLRSPHINKKSREQFEMRTHKRLIDIYNANPHTVEALNRLVVPAGVFVKIRV